MKKVLLSGIVLVGMINLAVSFPDYARKEKLSCGVCHIKKSGGSELTDNGKIYLKDKKFEKAPKDVKKPAEYKSMKKCKMCHFKEYKSWKKTPHAKAFEALVKATKKHIKKQEEILGVELKESPDKEGACLVCHTTGYGLKGGYEIGMEGKKAKYLKNVTCEVCHGPGSLHIKAKKSDKKKFINTKPTEKLCVSCHTDKLSPKFDFKKYFKKGVHKIKRKK